MLTKMKMYSIAAIVMLGMTTFTTNTFAETVVRHERVRHSRPAPVQVQEEKTTSVPVQKKESVSAPQDNKPANTKPVAEKPNMDSLPASEKTSSSLNTKSERIAEVNEKVINNSKEDNNDSLKAPSLDDDVPVNATKVDMNIFTGTHFEKFRLIGPKIQSYYGDAGDLAQLSSMIGVRSYFKLIHPDETDDEYIAVYFYKWRLAWALGSNYRGGISLEYNLDCQPIVSNKNRAKIQFTKNGSIINLELKKLTFHGSQSFGFDMSEKDIIDIFNSSGTVSLLLPTFTGDDLIVPIPKAAISQWKQVYNTDLKSMKKNNEKKRK